MPKISELTAATSVDDADSLVVVQGGTTKKATAGLVRAAPPRRVPTDSNTILNWQLDDASAPYANSGTGGTANLTVNAGSPKRVTGLFSDCVSFYDTTLTTGNSSIEPSGTALTVSAWVWINYYSSGGIVVAKVYNPDTTSWTYPFASLYMAQGTDNGKWTVLITKGSGSLIETNMTQPHRLPLYAWTLMAFTYDGSNVRTYLNGTLAVTTAAAGSIDYGSHGQWDVGGLSAPGQGGQRWEGYIHDVRIESVVRSEAYLQDMYRRGMGYTL